MTIRRGTLYAGVFVLALGAVTLAGVTGAVGHGAAGDAVAALWPLAVVFIGLALLLRRTAASLPTGILAAAAPGLLLGGSLVAIPSLVIPCTGGPAVATTTAAAPIQQGTLADGGRVDLHLACGDLHVTTQPGSSWQLDSDAAAAARTSVVADASTLTVTSTGGAHDWSNPGRASWQATLPSTPAMDVSTRIDAGRARLDLGGANLRNLALAVDAGDLRADLTGATLDRLTLQANAGSAVITLPADAFTGTVDASAGSVRLCAPSGLALRVHAQSSLGSVRFSGLVHQGDVWVSPGLAAPPTPVATTASPSATTSQNPAIADLTVNASVGSVTINSMGGCQ